METQGRFRENALKEVPSNVSKMRDSVYFTVDLIRKLSVLNRFSAFQTKPSFPVSVNIYLMQKPLQLHLCNLLFIQT